MQLVGSRLLFAKLRKRKRRSTHEATDRFEHFISQLEHAYSHIRIMSDATQNEGREILISCGEGEEQMKGKVGRDVTGVQEQTLPGTF